MKVIDPGVVHYEDLINADGDHVGGNVLVQKPVLDQMAESLVGKPIVNWDHRTVRPHEFSKGNFQGIVTEVYFDPGTGWYHAKGLVWDDATRRNIQNGYSISCAYVVKKWGDGGTYHKVPYEKEVLEGSYTHIAVVAVPRYEGARIELLNSAQGGVMGLLSLFKKDKPEEKVDIDVEKASVKIGESTIPLTELINSYRKQNPVPEAIGVGLTDLVMVDGKKIPVKDLIEAKLTELKNAEKQELEKDHEDGKHENKANKNCGMCNSAAHHEPTNLHEDASKLPKTYNSAEEKEKAAKEEAERKNAEKEEKEEKEKEERRNAAERAAKLDEMRNKSRQLEMPKIHTVTDAMAEGQARYGSKTPVAASK